MELGIRLLTVFGVGAVELWAAIPAGLALRVSPWATALAASLGAILSVIAIIWLGERARKWLLRRHLRAGDKPSGRLYRLWARYGVIGLGLSAPLLVGAPLGTALGITLGAPSGRLLFWMTGGIVLCSAVLTLIGALGIAGIQALGH